MSAWTVGAHAITAAAKENSNPEMHSMVRRPSQSAAGPATITLATAPIKAAATTKPSVAGVPSNLYSGRIYSSAPAGIAWCTTSLRAMGKWFRNFRAFGVFTTVGNYRKSLNSKTPDGSNKRLRWALSSSNFVEKIGFGFWILMRRRSGKVRGVCACAYQQLLRCPILEASYQLPQLLQQLLLLWRCPWWWPFT